MLIKLLELPKVHFSNHPPLFLSFDHQIKEGSAKITIDHEKLQANSKLNAQRMLILSIEVEQEKTGLTQTLIQELPISQREILVTLPSARMGKQPV